MGSLTRKNHSSYSTNTQSTSRTDNSQQKLTENQDDKPQKIFISFHHKDKNKVALLREQAENSDKLEFEDTSLKNPVKNGDWHNVVRERIKNSDQVIVAVGDETADREAVKWEIIEALSQGKPVIPLRLNSDKKDKLPASLKDEDAVVWNLEEIQNEIDNNKKEVDKNENQ